MAKLIVKRDGVSLREYKLDRQRVTIGRRTDNHVCLDDQTVSSEHAALAPLETPPSITDLGSTNGTLVNGMRIGKQTLRHGDLIRIGQHELTFVDEQRQDLNATVVLLPGAGSAVAGRLRVVEGPKAGTVLPLDRDRITLGTPGQQVAVVMREAAGFRLLPVTRGPTTRLNHHPVPATGLLLNDGDEIEIGGHRIRFEAAGP